MSVVMLSVQLAACAAFAPKEDSAEARTTYDRDVDACQTKAAGLNGKASAPGLGLLGGAFLGASEGALAGMHNGTSSGDGAWVGAVVGAAAGFVIGFGVATHEYVQLFNRCMAGRGYVSPD